MKKFFFFTIVLIGLVANNAAQAQEKRNVVKANPLGLLFGTASLSYERAIGAKTSILVAPSFGGFKIGSYKYSTVGLGTEFRAYFGKTKDAPLGGYFAPGIGYASGQVKDDIGDKINLNSLTVKGVFGHQWIWDNGFTLDLNGGIQYWKFSFAENKTSFSSLSASAVLPSLGFSLGYAF